MIIRALLDAELFKMLKGFPVRIPGIMIVKAPVFFLAVGIAVFDRLVF
jgi:hypothetical protein